MDGGPAFPLRHFLSCSLGVWNNYCVTVVRINSGSTAMVAETAVITPGAVLVQAIPVPAPIRSTIAGLPALPSQCSLIRLSDADLSYPVSSARANPTMLTFSRL